MLTQQYVSELFSYREGKLFWRVSRSHKIRIGDEAGYTRKDNGRRIVSVDGKLMYTHRLVFLLHNGWLPDEIDHKDNDASNNRIENLRAATRAENQWNTRKRADNSSGVKNVVWYAPTKRWTAQIRVNGQRKRLGYFRNIEDAAAAVNAAQKAMHGTFANTGELKNE